MRWLKWGIPVGLVVVLVAAVGGVLLARVEQAKAVQGETPSSQPGQMLERTSRSGVSYAADASDYPDEQIIEGVVDNYFDSINRKNYELWRSTVTPEKWNEMPKDKWTSAYDSVHDYDIRVNRIDPSQDRSALVMLSFRSSQSIEDAPPQVKSGCIQWNVVYPVVLSSTGDAVLDISKLPNSSIAAPC